MNILILNRVKTHLLDEDSRPLDSFQCLSYDYFMHGYYWGFKNLGHSVFLNWDHSCIFRGRFLVLFPKLSRLLYMFFRITQVYWLDRFLFSVFIGIFCKKNNIDFIFSELNPFVCPKIVKLFSPLTCNTQWIGVFPEMLPRGLKSLLPHYDFLWNPCIFDQSKQVFPAPLDKLYYIGSSVNTAVFYPDKEPKYDFDVVFIGSLGPSHSNRLHYLEAIADRFESFSFWGTVHPTLQISPKLAKCFKGWAQPNLVRKLLSSSKVAINLFLNNYDRVSKGCNTRLFEIAACNGACQLLPSTPLVYDFFEPSKDLLMFSDMENMIDLIDLLLKDSAYRQYLASNAYKKSSLYSFESRALTIASYFDKLT